MTTTESNDVEAAEVVVDPNAVSVTINGKQFTARKGDLIAFVEVKARRHVRDALDAVGPAAQHRIRSAGDCWLARQKDAHLLSLRYDIVAVQKWKLPRHFVDAF